MLVPNSFILRTSMGRSMRLCVLVVLRLLPSMCRLCAVFVVMLVDAIVL
jgi:hypothetical protein